jgi:hypothetical protein
MTAATQKRHPNWNAVSPHDLETVEAALLGSLDGHPDGAVGAIGALVTRTATGSTTTSTRGARENRKPTEDGFKVLGHRASEVLTLVDEEPEWLVYGVAPKGWSCKVAGREKLGKGTLVYYLLGKLERGQKTVFGQAAAEKHTALVYTEEPQDAYREKIAHFGLADSRIVNGWELAHLTTWKEKVAYLVWLAHHDGHEIVFVDNISRAAGVEEEGGVELARAVEHFIDAVKKAGKTPWIDHHHKKGGGALEDKSRGGTGTAGATDVNVEMVRVGSDWASRVRKVASRGRIAAVNWEVQIALDDNGSDYSLVAGDDQAQRATDRQRLRALSEFEDVTAAEFGAAINLTKRGALDVLKDFVEKEWATVDQEQQPHRFKITEAGHQKSHADPDNTF